MNGRNKKALAKGRALMPPTLVALEQRARTAEFTPLVDTKEHGTSEAGGLEHVALCNAALLRAPHLVAGRDLGTWTEGSGAVSGNTDPCIARPSRCYCTRPD